MDGVSLLPTKPDEFKAAVETLRRNMPSLIEYNKLMAEIRRAAYLSYIDHGFTPEQALELVKGDRA